MGTGTVGTGVVTGSARPIGEVEPTRPVYTTTTVPAYTTAGPAGSGTTGTAATGYPHSGQPNFGTTGSTGTGDISSCML